MLKRTMLVAGIIMVIVMIASLGIFTGCKDQTVAEEEGVSTEAQEENTEETSSDAEEETEEVVEEAEEGPIVVIDGLDNEVTLEKPAEKVIVLAPSSLETVDALGGMDKVIGVDNWSVDNNEPLAEGFEGFGDYQGFNMEKIVEAAPDLLIVLSGHPPEDIERVKEYGISVYTAEVSSLESVYGEIINIGKMLGLEDKAVQVSDELKSRVEEIYSKVKDLGEDEKPKVFYMVYNEPLWSAGSGTFIDDLIMYAGGSNIVSADGIEGYAEYSAEKLLENNPDIIIAGDGGMYDAKTPDFILEDQRFASVNAVIDGDVYIVTEKYVVRPNQNSINGLTMLATAIHPDIFGDFEMIK
ncbi:MAG: ABC transporter substrate-binding protein [Actinomycetota bacterium]|nr:MAG: ABC transporter substrate-binding protein [Actinomycetota bacterium]